MSVWHEPRPMPPPRRRRAPKRGVRVYLGGRVTHAAAAWWTMMEAVRKTPPLLFLALVWFAAGVAVTVALVAYELRRWLLIAALLYIVFRMLRWVVRRKREDFEANRALDDGPEDFGEWVRRRRDGK